MSRNKNVIENYIMKKAYEHKNDNFSLEDIVTAGYDVDKVSDEIIERATWQEGIISLRDMAQNTDFTRDEWVAKLSSLLRKSGMHNEERIAKIANAVTTNIYGYLRNVGWM